MLQQAVNTVITVF